MHRFAARHRNALWIALALALGSPGVVHAADPAPVAQSAQTQDNSATNSDIQNEKVHKSTTLSTVNVNAQTLAGGLMATQDQPKQVSTISAQAIAEVPITADYTQIINSAPGVNSASSDGFGLTDSSSYTIRGFNASEIGVTLDGVPVNDAGDYIPYASEYGEARNYESITVSPGIGRSRHARPGRSGRPHQLYHQDADAVTSTSSRGRRSAATTRAARISASTLAIPARCAAGFRYFR
jgi:iron complex outermembrane receptor protein